MGLREPCLGAAKAPMTQFTFSWGLVLGAQKAGLCDGKSGGTRFLVYSVGQHGNDAIFSNLNLLVGGPPTSWDIVRVL